MSNFSPSTRALELLKNTAIDTRRVVNSRSGVLSPHTLYKYPARFNPSVAALAMQCFSEPGEKVIDPFHGSGATLIEAMRHQRDCVGIDISELAGFVAQTATHIYTDTEIREVLHWAALQLTTKGTNNQSVRVNGSPSPENFNLPIGQAREIYLITTQLIASSENLSKWSTRLVRAAILRATQWALDMRREIPSVSEYRQQAAQSAMDAAYALRHFGATVKEEWGPNFRNRQHTTYNGSALSIAEKFAEKWDKSFDVMVTSPPYPGVHILYHRWQVLGRKETSLPFWIAGVSDSIMESEYNMFARRDPNADRYFDEMRGTMKAMRPLMKDGAFAVHVVGFKDPVKQLPRYLAVLKDSGFSERKYKALATADDGRLWRQVPGRRWYAEQQKSQGAAREVVLIFRVN